MTLTDIQKDIVQHREGALLVTAGPGSGKTRILIERAVELIQNQNSTVLALTFSNKAAEEITERLNFRLDEEESENVLVGTIHSFCLDIVLTRGKMIGLPSNLTVIENEKDKIEILKRVLSDVEISKKTKYDVNALLKQISEQKQKLFYKDDIYLYNPDDENFIYIFQAYNSLLIDQHLIDYDDILLYAYRLLTEKPQIVKLYSQLYRYVFVDEAQDLNYCQYAILKELCIKTKNLMLVGDENQSIYGFNGSDSKYMAVNFVDDFSPDIKKLHENFRSTKEIILAANKLIPGKNNNTVYPLKGEVNIKKFNDDNIEAEWVADEISKLFKNGHKSIEGKLLHGNIAVIARNRYVLNQLEIVLSEKNIPYNFKKIMRPIENLTEEAVFFECGIRLITNPQDRVTRKRAQNFFLQALDDSNLIQSLLSSKFKDSMNYKINLLYEIQLVLAQVFNDYSTFISGIEKLIDIVDNYVISTEDQYSWKEQFVNDMTAWKHHWEKYCSLTTVDQRSLSHFRHQVSLGRTINYDSEGVTLSTVHMSKGLEYDVVFIIGLCEGVFPDFRAKDETALTEELNSMFVALTRAKRVCYLTYPSYRKMPWGSMKKQYPSRFLKKIQDN